MCSFPPPLPPSPSSFSSRLTQVVHNGSTSLANCGHVTTASARKTAHFTVSSCGYWGLTSRTWRAPGNTGYCSMSIPLDCLTDTHTHMHTYTHTHTHTHMHTYTRTHTHAHIHTHTHTHKHTRTQTHTHIHTRNHHGAQLPVLTATHNRFTCTISW